EQAGGTWTQTSGAGGTFNAGAGTYTPAPGATTSTFAYTLVGTAPCINDTSVATININAQPNAGVDGNTTVCDSSVAPIDLFSLITGEQAGGTWTQTSGTGGTFNAGAGIYTPAPGATTSTFTYTLVGTAPCINDTSVATININAQPNAGTDGATITCENNPATINLFSLITGEQAGGTWTQTSGTGGTFNAAAGTFTPAMGATTSTFTYTLTGTAPCVNDSSVATVNVNMAPTATISYSGPYCVNTTSAQNVTLTGTGNYTGGTFSSTTGLSINATTGAITPSTSTPGTYVVTYTIPAGSSCLPVQTQTNVTITPKPVMTYTVTTPICDGSALNFVLSSNVPGTTYTWDASNNGLTGFNASGTQADINQVVHLTNPMVGGTITMVILPSANGCTGNPVTVNLVVNPNPVISSITVEDAQICSGSQVHIDVDGEPTGLTYTWTAVNNNGVIITSGTYSGTSANGALNLQLTTNSPTTIGTIQFEFTPIRNGCVGTPVLSQVIT
ncbi:PKD-like domain-containing protein, partial [Flavobacterium urocaniciphilum]